MGYLIGIDAGSTNYKAIACDYHGYFLAAATHKAETIYLDGGRAEGSPENMWSGVARCIKEVVEQLPGQTCDGIAVASCGEDVLLDENLKAVHPTIRWFDTRTSKIAEEWAEFGRGKVYNITGINPNNVAGITKMQWIMRNHPEAMEKAEYWISISGFISLMLTGKCRANWTNACRTMAFDLSTRNWSDEILDKAGFPKRILAEPIKPGELIGRTRKEVTEITGLPEGVPVYAGGLDYACGTFATGIINSGQMLDSTGTSEQLVAILDEPESSVKCMADNFTSVCYVVNNKYYVMGMIVASGGIFEWFKKLFGDGVSFDELVNEAEQRPLGADGCMLLPYFSGRFALGNDSAAKGAFVGVTRGTTRGDLTRAILEGLSFELYSIINEIETISNRKIDSIYAIGGASRSRFWMQLKADITGKKVICKAIQEAAALGAAMLAGLGAGIYSSPEDAVKQVVFPETVYEPDMEKHERYMAIYEKLHKQIYPALDTYNKTVTEMHDNGEL